MSRVQGRHVNAIRAMIAIGAPPDTLTPRERRLARVHIHNWPSCHGSHMSHPLPTSLDTAVPLWIATMRSQPIQSILDPAVLAQCNDVIQNNGEAALYRVNQKGKSAESFNAIAEAIARLSFVPGGIRIFGRHWESRCQ